MKKSIYKFSVSAGVEEIKKKINKDTDVYIHCTCIRLLMN